MRNEFLDSEPLWPKVIQAWNTASTDIDPNKRQKILAEAKKIENLVVSRNLKGIKFEKSGHIEKAIKL